MTVTGPRDRLPSALVVILMMPLLLITCRRTPTAHLPTAAEKENTFLRSQLAQTRESLLRARWQTTATAELLRTRLADLQEQERRADTCVQFLSLCNPQSSTSRYLPPAPLPSTPARELSSTTTSEWQRLEAEQRARNDDFEKLLDTTTVYLGGFDFSSTYHAAGCQSLWITVADQGAGGGSHRQYTGRPITLRQASRDRLSAAQDCGPPSYAFHY